MALTLTSPAFNNNEPIPEPYTCDGVNINPPLSIRGVPEGCQSLVLIIVDHDNSQGIWSHWLLWNIPPTTTEILENSTPIGAVLGLNDFKDIGYGGPCPQSGNHQYEFKLYALDTLLDLESASTLEELEDATLGHVMEQTSLNGYYSREKLNDTNDVDIAFEPEV